MPTAQDFKALQETVKKGYPTALVQQKAELTIADADNFIDMLVKKSRDSLAKKEFVDYLKDIEGYKGNIEKLNKIRKLLGEFSYDGKFKIITSNGKNYIVFKGYPGRRNIFTGTRYSTNTPKIVDMAITKTGIVKDALKGSLLTLVVYVPLNFIKTFMQDKPTIGYFLGVMASDVIKVGTSAAFAAGTSAIIAASTGLVVLPIAAGLIVGIAIGMALNEIDNRYKLTEKLIEYFEDNIDRPLSRFLYELERSIRWKITRQIPF